MAEYRFLAYDLRGNTLIGELPLASVRYGKVLNGAGTLDGYVTLGQRTQFGASLDSTYISCTLPRRTALVVERDGVLTWGGIIWGRQYNSTNRQLQIRAAEFWSYFSRRINRSNLVYTAVDQLTVVRSLITSAQGAPGGNIGVTLDSTASGVVVERTFRAFERGNIADLVSNLSKADNGFDYAIDVSYNTSGLPQKVLNLGFPRRGRSASVTGHVFELGANVGYYTFDEDGSRSASSVDILGPGEGDAMLITGATSTAQINAGYPLLDETISKKGGGILPSLPDLTRFANEALRVRDSDVINVTLQDIQLDRDPALGSWIVGDDLRFRIDDDYRFPRQADGSPGLDMFFRIVADEVRVSDAGVETATLTCTEV